MITFEHTEVLGWEHAIRGMRNPLNSWEKSDSGTCMGTLPCHICEKDRKSECNVTVKHGDFVIGPNDQDLMKRLRNSGTDHRKYMRYIMVYLDIEAPLYWWKEFETYRAGVYPGQEPINPMDIEMNSCGTMHKIHAKEFTIDDFSHEHLIIKDVWASPLGGGWRRLSPVDMLNSTIELLNEARRLYLETKDKKYWWQMIQLLPSSYNQKRTVMLNYEVLANMYKSRKDHKLDEWKEFCDWIKELPYSELIVGEPSPLSSPEEVNELFKKVMEVDGRVKSYRVFDKMGMKILDFYDANHKTLYAVDLYRVTLDEVLAFIKEEIVKLTRQNLALGA